MNENIGLSKHEDIYLKEQELELSQGEDYRLGIKDCNGNKRTEKMIKENIFFLERGFGQIFKNVYINLFGQIVDSNFIPIEPYKLWDKTQYGELVNGVRKLPENLEILQNYCRERFGMKNKTIVSAINGILINPSLLLRGVMYNFETKEQEIEVKKTNTSLVNKKGVYYDARTCEPRKT